MQSVDDFSKNRFDMYENLTKKHFAFLVEDHGFSISKIHKVADQSIFIEYKSDKVFVRLHYGVPDFELDFFVGRIDIDSVGFNSSDLIAVYDAINSSNYRVYAANSYNNLLTCLPKLADVLKSIHPECLEGKTSFYENMRLDKQKRVSHWGDEQELKQSKRAAKAAWDDKDYPKFIEIFEPIASSLSPSELKKLEYARNHVQKSDGFLVNNKAYRL